MKAMPRSERAFARVDLLAIVVVSLLLTGVVAPAASRGKWSSNATHCLAGKERLAKAWSLFTLDNDGLGPGAIHGGAAISVVENSPMRPWAQGWLDWGSTSINTNWGVLVSPRYSSIAQYLPEDRRVFHCPADMHVSRQQRALKWTHRARSVSASIHVGQGNGAAGDGPWGVNYFKVRKISEMANPSPSAVYTFIDEHPDSMNDGAFFSPTGDGVNFSFVDIPSNLHNTAATVAFADGRAEIHAWKNAPIRSLRVTTGGVIGGPTGPAVDDARWLYLRTPRRPGL